ncbi:MAG: TraR/DksA C4-type zinc finger protein [Desulfobacterales bacterium]|nr:TraR/DksA C4-type zinc finger protein [Desulfobacterales bacterium]
MTKPTRTKPAKKGRAQKQPAKPAPKAKPQPKSKASLRTVFLESLQVRRQEIKETLDRLKNSRMEYGAQHTAGDFIDEVDDAQREISAYSQYSLIERKARELRKVEQLIQRVNKDEEYGLCEECGNQIPPERLLIMPEAGLCVPCQREFEKLDQKRSMAVRGSSTFGSRKEMDWEGGGPGEEDENMLIEYHIGSLPMADMEETEVEGPPEEKEEK